LRTSNSTRWAAPMIENRDPRRTSAVEIASADDRPHEAAERRRGRVPLQRLDRAA
jgi:hypothetical protein